MMALVLIFFNELPQTLAEIPDFVNLCSFYLSRREKIDLAWILLNILFLKELTL